MKTLNQQGLCVASLALTVLCFSNFVAAQMKQKFVYPQAPKVDQTDDYHGTKVADPYRWLEDPDSAASRAWIEAENKITFDFLGQIPEREKIRARITELWNYERFGTPFREGGRYFITRNDG